MLWDKKHEYSWDQAITVTADSATVIDLGAANQDLGAVTPVYLCVILVVAFTSTANTLIVALHDSADDSTFNALITFPTVATSTLGTPKVMWAMALPRGLRRYSKLVYTCSTTLVSGVLSAGLTLDVPYKADWM